MQSFILSAEELYWQVDYIRVSQKSKYVWFWVLHIPKVINIFRNMIFFFCFFVNWTYLIWQKKLLKMGNPTDVCIMTKEEKKGVPWVWSWKNYATHIMLRHFAKIVFFMTFLGWPFATSKWCFFQSDYTTMQAGCG